MCAGSKVRKDALLGRRATSRGTDFLFLNRGPGAPGEELGPPFHLKPREVLFEAFLGGLFSFSTGKASGS